VQFPVSISEAEKINYEKVMVIGEKAKMQMVQILMFFTKF